MVAIVRRYANALASGLVPLLSTLSAGTEMASYGPAQWEFLLDSDGVTTFVAVDDNDTGIVGQQQPLLGCLLRIDMNQHQQHHTPDSSSSSSSREALAGFGMMLVGNEARGKGVAKKLLHEAMSITTTDSAATAAVTRNLLAVCTSKGQPVYRKLGYAEVGRVTALKTTLGALKDTAGKTDTTDTGLVIKTHGSLDRTTGSSPGAAIDPAVVEMVAAMDARATGWDRKGRIRALLHNDPSRARRSVVAIATSTKSDGDSKEQPIGAAVLRREGPGSPLVVGPLLGNQETALPLVSTLARSVNSGDADLPLSLLISDHPELVDRLQEAGFAAGFDLPAMSLDGRPVYEHGDGNYLGLIHPTLG